MEKEIKIVKEEYGMSTATISLSKLIRGQKFKFIRNPNVPELNHDLVEQAECLLIDTNPQHIKIEPIEKNDKKLYYFVNLLTNCMGFSEDIQVVRSE